MAAIIKVELFVVTQPRAAFTDMTLRETIEREPTNANEHYIHAVILRHQNKPEAALEHLKEALTISPWHADATRELLDLLPNLEYRSEPTYDRLMDAATILKAAAELKGLSSVAELDEAVENYQAAKINVPAHDTAACVKDAPRTASTRARREARAIVTAHAAWQPPSVPLPEGLKWPIEQFKGSPEFQKPGGIVRHLERVWKPLIRAGAIDMALLRSFYPSTASGIDRFKHNGGGEPRVLRSDIDIPLLKAGSGRHRRLTVPQPT